jgi:hypothetical protein
MGSNGSDNLHGRTCGPQHFTSQLLANGHQQQPVRGTDEEIDFEPVVKLFTPWGGANWLLTEIEPDEPDLAFGLCDLGMGFPELGRSASPS